MFVGLLIFLLPFGKLMSQEVQPVEAIVFDVGGVVVRWKTDPRTVFSQTCESFGVDLNTGRTAYKRHHASLTMGQMTDEAFWEAFSLEVERPIPEGWMAYWNDQFVKNFALNEALIERVITLKEAGYQLAILSNVFPAHARALRSEGFYHHFDTVILSCDVNMQKPDPAIFLHLLETIGKKPEAILYIDDREENIAAAKQLGMQTFLFSYDWESADVLIERLSTL